MRIICANVAALFLFVSVPLALAAQDKFLNASNVQHAAGSATVTATDGRSLWMAMNALEREYGWSIDFEDPVWAQSETTLQHNPLWDKAHPDNPSRCPAGKHFQSTYAEDASDPRRAVNGSFRVISTVVQDYNASGNPGRFIVQVEPSGRIEVTGFSSDTSRASIDVLATRVSVDDGNAAAVQELASLVKALSVASGIKVELGVVPWNLFGRKPLAIPRQAMPARDVLALIADSATVPLMWDLLYDYDTQSYLLNLKAAKVMKKDMLGQWRLLPSPQFGIGNVPQ